MWDSLKIKRKPMKLKDLRSGLSKIQKNQKYLKKKPTQINKINFSQLF